MKQRLGSWVLSPCWWSFHYCQSLDPGVPKKPDSDTCPQAWILIPNTQWTVTTRDGEKQRKKISSICPHWEEQMKMSNWWVLWRLFWLVSLKMWGSADNQLPPVPTWASEFIVSYIRKDWQTRHQHTKHNESRFAERKSGQELKSGREKLTAMYNLFLLGQVCLLIFSFAQHEARRNASLSSGPLFSII